MHHSHLFLLLVIAAAFLNMTTWSIAHNDEIYFETSEEEESSIDNILMTHPQQQQQQQQQHHQHKKHKDLLPLDVSDYVGTFLVALGLLIAASGGIGGGGILVPLYILVFGFKPKFAIALSNFTILGSSIMNIVLNLPKRHPLKDRPLVDWDLVLAMLPLTMAGVLAGAFVGLLLPDAIVMLLLIILLGFTTYTTLEKGISQYKNETLVQLEKSNAQVMHEVLIKSEESNEKQGLLHNDEDGDEGDAGHSAESSFTISPKDPELIEILEKEKTSPPLKIAMISVLFIGIIIMNILKGGKGGYGSPIGIECGSTTYWGLTLIIFIWIFGVFYYLRSILIEEWKVKKRLRYKFEDGDVEWTPQNSIVFPAICALSGVFAGMFGIGGGIVMGPIMLQMGINPMVISATSAAKIFFTAFTGTSAFAAFGLITWDYAWFLFVVGLVSTAIGQFGVSYLIQKYKRTSFISLSIGAVVALSTILLSLESIINYGNESEAATLCGE